MEVIYAYIRRVNESGKAIIIISHQMDSIFSLSQRLLVLNFGDLIADGPPEMVKNDPAVIEAYLGTTTRRTHVMSETSRRTRRVLPGRPDAGSGGREGRHGARRMKDLSVGYYRDLNILSDLHITARQGQITTILGANGVGKSTALKAAFGFLTPNKGDILLEGESILHIPPHEKILHGLAYIPQQPGVFKDMTVEENLELGGWTFRRDRKQVRARSRPTTSASRRCATSASRSPESLSGGQQRMVEIGRTLMSEPKMLLVDEPTAGLPRCWPKRSTRC